MRARTSDETGLFSPAVLGFLVASAVALFALSVLLAAVGGGDTPSGTTAESPSAIGHKGFLTLLRRLDLPVAESRLNAQVPAGEGDLVIVQEPGQPPRLSGRRLDDDAPPDVLLILPKWSGLASPFHDGWIATAEFVDVATPKRVLAVVDRKASLARVAPPTDWGVNVLSVTPALDGKVQLIAGSTLRPLIGTQDAMLLGERLVDDRRIWVLADPDPLENHGLATPANTRFALALVEALRGGSGRIVFDETIHGLVAPERNVLQLLFHFPFVIVTIEVLVALGLLLLATMGRFGGVESVPPPFKLGKATLIDTIAALMDRAGHQAVILRRYLSVRLAETGSALHAPRGLDDAALARWLDGIGAARHVEGSAMAAIADTAHSGRARTLQRLFEQAHAMHIFSRDILNGTGRRQSRH